MTKINSVSVIPTPGYFSVYESEGKLYKNTLIGLLAIYKHNDESGPCVDFKTIELADVQNGFILLDEGEAEKLNRDSNFKGILSNQDEFIKLTTEELNRFGLA